MVKFSTYISVIFVALVLSTMSQAMANIKIKTIEYKHEKVTLSGKLLYNDLVGGKRPAVILVHEWWGITPELIDKAKRLVNEGYVAFVADLYGDARSTEHPEEAGTFMKEVVSDISIWRARAKLAIDVVKKQEQVDATNVAAIGFCLGGNTVLQMFYARMDIKAAVAFHSTLVLPQAEDTFSDSKTKLLILHGAYDPLVPENSLDRFNEMMKGKNVDWQLNLYPAQHAFTNPKADSKNIPGLAYNPRVYEKSWRAMHGLFSTLFN